MSNKNCNYGFVFERGGTYKITDTKIGNSWEYIYQNGDVLLRVDQYGLAYAQAKPVKDIILFWRTASDKYSKWMVWINSKETGTVNNFSFPRTKEPIKGEITYYPEKAVYFYDYGTFSVTTEVMIPLKGTNIIMFVKVKNNSGKSLDLDIMPALYPYINRADYPVWDKPEWYNKTTVGKRDNTIEFLTRLNDAYGEDSRRRLVTFHTDGGASAEIRLEKYNGIGSFDMPDAVKCKELDFSYGSLGEAGVFDDDRTYVCYPFVYACKYNISLNSGESKTFTQVLSMQSIENYAEYNSNEAEKAIRFLNEDYRKAEEIKVKEYYEKLFSVNSIQTKDKLFDYYINTFLPLQANWVASLDRGWPTGLRGVRDAANDFMGVLYFDENWARKVLVDLYCCQRTDGWMPRQVSMVSRKQKHDMRRYSDSGAFLMEFLYEYICKSGDLAVLDEKLPWLDSDEESTLYEHMKKSFEHYLTPENIGEHGLVKIYEGDWMDALNRAGLNGRGETVMVTCQLIMNLYYAAEIIRLYKGGKDEDAANHYIKCAEKFKENLNTYAYNKKGFYNGAFNDEGKWVFSDKDEDGAERYYGSVNYYAVLCGAAQGERQKSVLDYSERLKTECGYRLFTPPFGKRLLNSVGRVASGDQAPGLFENGSVYNHVQGFRCRALAVADDGDKLFETIKYMLPYSHVPFADKDIPPAPYAMTNCYQLLSLSPHRAGFTFLTGSISMAIRVVYDCLLGIKPALSGLFINPCLPSGEKNMRAEYTFRGKKITINYNGKGGNFSLLLNGIKVTQKKKDYLDRDLFFIPVSDLKDENTVDVLYEYTEKKDKR